MKALLDLEDIRRIERLAQHFRWRMSGTAALPGRGAGRRLGVAGEFEGYRPLQSGDSVRGLDTRVYARLRRPMARVLREDSIVPVTLLVDRSASMRGAQRERMVEALTVFFLGLARRQTDPVRVFTFAGGDSSELPLAPGARSRAVLDALARRGFGEAEAPGSMGRAFRELTPHRAGRGLVLVVSDGMGVLDPDRELAPLARVGFPFWLAPLDPEDRCPTWDGRVALRSREAEPRWRGFVDHRTREEYRSQLERYQAALRRRLMAWGGDFFVVRTESPLVDVLQSLRARGRLLA